MNVSLSERQYNLLKDKRDQFDNAKFKGNFTGLTHEWKRTLAVVYGELFGASSRALNYQCNECLLSALKQFHGLMVEYENRQAALIQTPVVQPVEILDPVCDPAIEELKRQEQEDKEQILQIINNQSVTDIIKKDNKISRVERLAAESKARRNK